MDWLELSWKVLVARGVLGILFGIVAMAWPVSTAVALIVLWGVWALVDGIGSLAAVFGAPGLAPKLLLGLMGVLGLLAAFVAFTRPGLTAVTLTWLLGLWLIARGVVDLVATLVGRRTGSILWGVLAAGLSVVAGIIFAANPGRSAVALAFWLGLLALLWGVVFLVSGLMVRRQAGSANAAPSAA